MKTKNLIALSLGWFAALGAGCASNVADQSSVNANEAPPAAFPVAITPSESDASRYFVYVPSQGGETGFNYCVNNTLDECQRGVGARPMTAFNDPRNRRFYVIGPAALPEGTKLLFVSVNGTQALKTRVIQTSAGGTATALESPKERQVFQRDTSDHGKIIVQVKDTAARFVRAKVSGTARSNNVVASGDFKEYEVTSSRAAVDSPAGGWFTLDVILLDANKKTIGQAQVKEVGVGEVFLVAGQSNSSNCGRVPQTVDNDFVISTDGKAWQKGNDPQLGTHDDHLCNSSNGYGGSNWPNTGNALVARYRVPVAFASTGYSGSPIRDWVPSASSPANDNKSLSLFEYTAKRAEQLAVGGFRAVLWHQGENDAKDETTKADYKAKLGDVISGVRGRTKASNPWLIAVASWCKEDAYPAGADGKRWKGASAEITGAQQEIVSSRQLADLFSGPTTDDLNQDYRGTSSEPNDCHFNDRGLKEVGKRWADKIIAFVDGKVGTTSDATPANTTPTPNTNGTELE